VNGPHEEISQQISLALDGALSREEERRLRAHLQECPTCATLWEEMRGVSGLFERPPLLAPPPLLAARVMRRIERRERWRTWVRRLTVALLVLILLTTALSLPLMGLSTLAVNHPALSQVVLRAFVRAIEVVRALWAALGMMARAFLGRKEWLFLAVWLVLAVIAGVGWMRLVLRARRIVAR